MVIGKGLVGRTFAKYGSIDEFLIFASGVSNSKNCTPDDAQREETLLISSINDHPSKTLVYFSTTSISDPDLRPTPYIRHKIRMEEIVRSHAGRFHIFRTSNLAGRSENPYTILNYYFYSIDLDRPFTLWKYAERNILDVADLFRICDTLMTNGLFSNAAVNIANTRNYPVRYIVQCIEAYTRKKARYTEEEKGEKFTIDICDILPTIRSLNITFGDDYLPKVLEKYYPR